MINWHKNCNFGCLNVLAWRYDVRVTQAALPSVASRGCLARLGWPFFSLFGIAVEAAFVVLSSAASTVFFSVQNAAMASKIDFKKSSFYLLNEIRSRFLTRFSALFWTVFISFDVFRNFGVLEGHIIQPYILCNLIDGTFGSPCKFDNF